MILIVLSSDNLSRVGIIDDPISVIWNNKYFSSGDFQITVDSNEYNRNLLKKNSYIIRQDVNDEIGIIETIARIGEKDKKGKLIVSGRFAQSLLARRVVWDKTLLQGNLLTQLQSLIDINAIFPIDKNGILLPERSLVTGLKKEGVITDYYTRKDGEKVQLRSITAEITRLQSGSGVGSDYLFTTKANYKTGGSRTTLAVSSLDPLKSFNFGRLLKNYYSQVADTIEIQGNKYVKKVRNTVLTNIEDLLWENLTFFRNWVKADVFSRSVLPTDFGVFNTEWKGGFSKDYKDIGIYMGLKNYPFSEDFAIESSKRDTEDLYIYQEGEFLVFGNAGKGVNPDATNHNSIIDPMFTALTTIIMGWQDVSIYMTNDEEKTEDTGILVTDIPQESMYYRLNDINTIVGFAKPSSEMLLEVTTISNTESQYLKLNPSYPDISASLYEIVKGNNLLEYVEKSLQNNGLGLKALYSASEKRIYLTFYSGEDKTKKVVFSRELDSLGNYEVTETTQGKYNVVRISGENEEEEIWTDSGVSSGLDRNETYENIGDLKGFSEIDYIQSMQNSGKMTLQGFSIAIGAEIIAKSYKYRQDYNLGDIVTINIKEIELSYKARILEVCETFDNTGYKITLVIGE